MKHGLSAAIDELMHLVEKVMSSTGAEDRHAS